MEDILGAYILSSFIIGCNMFYTLHRIHNGRVAICAGMDTIINSIAQLRTNLNVWNRNNIKSLVSATQQAIASCPEKFSGKSLYDSGNVYRCILSKVGILGVDTRIICRLINRIYFIWICTY